MGGIAAATALGAACTESSFDWFMRCNLDICKKLVDWGYDRKDRILCECNGYVADENPWYDEHLQEGKNVGGCVSVRVV